MRLAINDLLLTKEITETEVLGLLQNHFSSYMQRARNVGARFVCQLRA